MSKRILLYFLLFTLVSALSYSINPFKDKMFAVDTINPDTLILDTVAVDTADIDYIDDNGVIHSSWGDFILAIGPDYDDDCAVTSVAGVEFGDSKYKVIPKLQSRFGYDYREYGTYISFTNPTIGGNDFTFGYFYFDDSKFAAAQLIRVFKTSEFTKAKQFRDMLASQYGKKYKNINSKIDADGYKYYRCGRVVNSKYPIMIYLFKAASKGGQLMYYVHVDYFEINKSLNNDI